MSAAASRVRRLFAFTAAGVVALCLTLGAAGAGGLGAPAAPLTGTSVLVSGMSSCPVVPGFNKERVGASALMDDGKYLFFSDQCNGMLYRLPSSGGTPAQAVKAKHGKILVLVKSGSHYYASVYAGDATGGLWEFDPTTLAWKSSAPAVAEGGIIGAATDPKTHDVFLAAGAKILRVHNLTGAKPVVNTFVTGGGGDLYDSLAFTPSGSMLYVTDRYNYPSIHIVGFNRAGKSVLDIVDPYQGEGLAVARSGALFVNNNGTDAGSPATYGSVSMLAPGSKTLTTVASGGTRGGFATVDCRGFMLVDQTSAIVKLSPALFPKNAGAGACTSSVKRG